MKYTIQDLTLEQVSDIYNEWIYCHFPKEEIKPFASIQRMWSINAYRALGMYEPKENGQQLIAYAFLAMTPDSRMLLLDYLAVVEEYREQGMGGIFLKEMRGRLKEFDGILIETEDIAFAGNEEERVVRKRRNTFYEQNEAICTQIRSRVYGVPFTIWQLPVARTVTDTECQKNLEDIYQIMIPGAKYDKYVKIQSDVMQ